MILVVAVGEDLHAHAVVDGLRRRAHKVCWVDLAALDRALRLTFTLDGTSAGGVLVTEHGQRVSLSEIDTVWWRRPRLPSVAAQFEQPTQSYVRSEWEHFVDGLEVCTSARWINAPTATRVAARKTRQLAVASAVGMRIPRTLITNDPQAVRALAADGAQLVYKRLGDSPRPISPTRPLQPTDFERLDTLRACPAIFQERINARLDIRVTVIGENLYGAEIDSSHGGSPLDWRFDMSVPFRPHSLSAETTERLRRLMRELGLVYGAIDLRLTEEGEYVFLEVNPAGQYLFIELLGRLSLTDHMVDFLAGHEFKVHGPN
jgi:hypothetical protein